MSHALALNGSCHCGAIRVAFMPSVAAADLPLRVHLEDTPMPYAANLEALALPSVEKIVKAVKQVTYTD